ncbi:MAG TPA: MlrC C-terminal domain-containing protein, partial [Ruminococcus bicirculans (ex Wegman et al. 2014)]|nr:MlrC C-terminal domain-containing protein [Ruminococcus bicirculans (ex Wegman et al. 2014)]
MHLDPLDKIISTIKSAPSKKYAVIDECDDPLGGGPADGTYILDKLIEGGINKIGVSTICDREITEMAFAAGEGAVIKGLLGGKTDNKHGRPLPITAVVTKLICKPIPMCEANG